MLTDKYLHCLVQDTRIQKHRIYNCQFKHSIVCFLVSFTVDQVDAWLIQYVFQCVGSVALLFTDMHSSLTLTQRAALL